ncbi:hypothetical protein [Aminobacter ciceronei]|uniref:NAD(P)H-dependent FMN reductase n=1 Tax=Aminobacter ciceronei TaxID=150723 RepID=A0ABR6C6L0_9HYPH|nr:hypothetical protein [Aminobacter ciceronei]MBA8906810.1 NAD(P)H-dependent FMN reductase [Aminobacter ciceronei]MBA9020589.1 NAD(P)H-dependent FMN reductase [Aminobacter ciceronei]
MIDPDDELDVAQADAEPARKPKSSKAWLSLITSYEKAGYEDYQTRCANIEKQYANLARLASVSRSREFQIFWANIEVLKPSMYARPPIPVVATRFNNTKPIPRAASELLERSTAVTFDSEDIDGVMRRVRDDLAINARGCIWVRYEAKSKDSGLIERVCIEHKNRRDFAHEPGRGWIEVGWVAGRAWMTRKEMRQRFQKTSGNAYAGAIFAKQKDDKNKTDGKLKAGVWEIWSKTENKVVWVTPGVDVVLDEDKPHLSLEGFFPCPQPAYGTVEPNSLIPVPDFLFYKDQAEEVNELTNRISALTQALKVRGFYPSGAGELSDAIEAAIKSVDDRKVLVPVSNWAVTGSAKDTIVWLPLDMVATTLTQLIALRKQLIEDIYQISGLSDVMRGATNPNETLGAQTLKSQYGSVRIRDRQAELVRIARDTARIVAEIQAENFQAKTLLDMSQMEFETDAEVSKAIKALEAQAKQVVDTLKAAQANPQVQQMAQANPEQAQASFQQAQQQVEQIAQQVQGLEETITIDKVMKFLRDERIRPFTLDIETDSTIQPDEDAAKKRTAEFLTALGGALAQLSQMVAARPETAPFAGEILKFAIAPFRPGRQMQASIDEFVEKMKASAGQPQPDPRAAQAESEAKANSDRAAVEQAKAQATVAKSEADIARINADAALKQREADIRIREIEARAAADAQKHAQDMQKGELELARLRLHLAQQAQKGIAPMIEGHIG